MAGYRELTAEERTQVIAEIHTVTRRPDLLAEVAGVMLGVAPSRLISLEVERHERMAGVLIEAGADEAVIPQWAEGSRKRAEDAQAIPYIGARR